MKEIHYNNPTYPNYPLCYGVTRIRRGIVSVTDDKEHVTCKACKDKIEKYYGGVSISEVPVMYSGLFMCEVNDFEDCIADADRYGICGDLAKECPWRKRKDVIP